MTTPVGSALSVLSIDILDKTANKIGSIQSINPTHNRGVVRCYEIDSESDGIPFDMVTGVETISISVNGMALKAEPTRNNQLHTRFQRNIAAEAAQFYSLRQNKTYFDIKIKQRNEVTGFTYVSVYRDCLLTNYSSSITMTGDVTISESASIEVRFMGEPELG